MKKPEMKIQLIHIDGPFKGEINEYLSPVVTLGRHPDCDVAFPEDQRGISRNHAEIRREGNRFLLRDNSKNGTFVNGKQNAEVFLKNGDVLILGTGGPKISFISSVVDSAESDSEPVKMGKTSEYISIKRPPDQPAAPVHTQEKNIVSEQATRPPVSVSGVQKTLVIQHGAVIKVFKTLPITLGRGHECDFIIQGPHILEQHVQILFDQGQYWVKDLTGRNVLTLNSQTVQTAAPLLPNASLSLGQDGPTFTFLGDGRLVEVEAAVSQGSSSSAPFQDLRQAERTDTSTGRTRRVLVVCGILVLCACLAGGIYLFMGNDGNPVLSLMEKAQQTIRHLFSKQ